MRHAVSNRWSVHFENHGTTCVATVVHPLIHRPTPLPGGWTSKMYLSPPPFAPRLLDKFPDNVRPRVYIAKLNGGCGRNGGEGLREAEREEGVVFIHQASKSLVIKFDRLVYWGRAQVLGPPPPPPPPLPRAFLTWFWSIVSRATLAITHAISCAATSPIQPVNHLRRASRASV